MPTVCWERQIECSLLSLWNEIKMNIGASIFFTSFKIECKENVLLSRQFPLFHELREMDFSYQYNVAPKWQTEGIY